jgi:hypothetical protein
MSSEQLKILEDARNELQKQLISIADSIAKGFQRTRTFEDIDDLTKVQAGIEAVDRAIATIPSRISTTPPGTSPLEQFAYRNHSSASRVEPENFNPDHP